MKPSALFQPWAAAAADFLEVAGLLGTAAAADLTRGDRCYCDALFITKKYKILTSWVAATAVAELLEVAGLVGTAELLLNRVQNRSFRLWSL